MRNQSNRIRQIFLSLLYANSYPFFDHQLGPIVAFLHVADTLLKLFVLAASLADPLVHCLHLVLGGQLGHVVIDLVELALQLVELLL